MNIIKNSLLASTMVALVACGGEQTSNDESAETPGSTAPITYSHNSDSTVVKWTAFKFTEKTGVSGTFNKVDVSGTAASSHMASVYSNASFNISTGSVNSNNPDRDKKITDHFFGSMLNTDQISGKVLSIAEDKAMVSIEMNDVSKEAAFVVATSGNRLSLIGTINLGDWNALASVDSLNTICYDLHTGKDSISILWPDIDIEITTVLNSDGE